MRVGTTRILAVAGLAGAAVLAGLPAGAADRAGRTKGYVVSDIFFAFNEGDPAADCPDGIAITPREYYVDALPDGPDKRRWLADKVKATAEVNFLAYKMFDAECKDPTIAKDRGLNLFGAAKAYGLNLDGGTSDSAAAPNSCAHRNFISPSGEPGIDNQIQRVLGCITGFRRSGHLLAVGSVEDNFRTYYQSGQHTVLIELSELDDPKNDPDVTVGIYSSTEPAPFDATGRPLTSASLQVHDNPRYHNIAKGRIRDGVLTTDPIDMRLKLDYGNVKSEYDLRQARVRLEVRADGTLSGLLGGYYDIENFYDGQIRQTGVAAPIDHGFSCTSVYRALQREADGVPDADGKCTAISTALRIDAVHAHVIHPKPAPASPQTAEAK